jgi:hypothetical protein
MADRPPTAPVVAAGVGVTGLWVGTTPGAATPGTCAREDPYLGAALARAPPVAPAAALAAVLPGAG